MGIREIGEINFAIIYFADVVEKLLCFGYKMYAFLHFNGYLTPFTYSAEHVRVVPGCLVAKIIRRHGVSVS